MSGKFSEVTDERPNQPAVESQAAPKLDGSSSGDAGRLREEEVVKRLLEEGDDENGLIIGDPCVLPSPRQPHTGGSRRAKMLTFFFVFPLSLRNGRTRLGGKQKTTQGQNT